MGVSRCDLLIAVLPVIVKVMQMTPLNDGNGTQQWRLRMRPVSGWAGRANDNPGHPGPQIFENRPRDVILASNRGQPGDERVACRMHEPRAVANRGSALPGCSRQRFSASKAFHRHCAQN